MIDPLFYRALYFFFMNHHVVLYSVGIVAVFVFLVALLTLFRKWGESY